MATALYFGSVYRPLPRRRSTLLRHATGKSAHVLFISSKGTKTRRLLLEDNRNYKLVVRLSLVEQSPPKPSIDVKQFVDFLYEDLPHLFDDQGIDKTAYDERVKFRDPITKHDTVSGYLFNIAMLKKLFRPDFQLHWVKQVCMCKNGNIPGVLSFPFSVKIFNQLKELNAEKVIHLLRKLINDRWLLTNISH